MRHQFPQSATLITTLLATSLGGCAVGPKYVQPDLVAPASLVSANALAASTPLSRVDETPAELAAWWRGFKDPELDALVGHALSDNLDRQTAASRVREANDAALAVRANLLPSLTGSAGYDHTRISNNAGLSQISSLIGEGCLIRRGRYRSVAGSGVRQLHAGTERRELEPRPVWRDPKRPSSRPLAPSRAGVVGSRHGSHHRLPSGASLSEPCAPTRRVWRCSKPTRSSSRTC